MNESTMGTPVTSADDVFRPLEWDDFVGQKIMMNQLSTHIDAARSQIRPLDHVLLCGPPGFGKTSLVQLIHRRLNDPLVSLTMPVKPAAMMTMFKRFEGGILFLDELQSASKSTQEDLQTVLLDGYYSTPSGTRLMLPFITVIGATTEKHLIIKPLRDRFIHIPYFADYTEEEMGILTQAMAKRIGLELSMETCVALGKACGGTPRNAKRLVLTARDLLEISGKLPDTETILNFCMVDPDGLTQDHLAYLRCVAESGDVAGLKKIAMQLRLHEQVVLDLERLLVAQGLLNYTNRGRELSAAGYSKAAGNVAHPVLRVQV